MAPTKSETKAKSDVKVLKGQDAEDLVLDYVKRVTRLPQPLLRYSWALMLTTVEPIQGAVPKTAVQKILVALAERGELVQKTYGKTSFFVANQANIEAIPAERLAELEEEYKAIDGENKILGAGVKTLSSELAKLKSTPTDAELDVQILEITEAIKKADAQLQPLRSGAPLISAEDLEQVDADWTKWRAEWVRRKKIFNEYDPFSCRPQPGCNVEEYVLTLKLSFWHLATDTLSPQDAATLAEDLGIEQDTNEHSALERSPLVTAAQRNLKRKR
ncbi:Tbp1-interacting protein tbpip [Mycena venus]|uniref:Tbp1-interacting protein tbpip n=1 Tax=Mycena venus TaxID=2733690 RepID=A0A8H6YJ24_9AGAR|nr:Tbp1-interacting protein tbpip [Mycena venus]